MAASIGGTAHGGGGGKVATVASSDQATLDIHTDSSHRRLVVTSCGGGDGDSGSGRPRGDAGQLLRTRGLWLMSSDQLTTVAAAGNEQAVAGPQLRDDVGAITVP